MFLHCHNCKWSQDDFWIKGGYNPLRLLLEPWEDVLFEENIDEKFHDTNKTKREIILEELERSKILIRNMHFRTEEEWDNASNPKCPKCNGELDLD